MGDTNREWKYDAFISYRHLEPDAYVAGTLHKLLESYKLPGNLVKANGDKLKRTKIKKVFRDAEELPLTSNLNDTIIEALENSEYLIAICSPKFGESLWCKKEVDTFIEMRGLDHVLTVLVDGEPSESFPEVLLYRNIEVKKEDGSVEIVREPIEPLAANARGANNKERLKVLKNEYLRLMAPMFGCSFDDLKQRHREQRMKRTMKIIGGVAAVCLAFGIVSTSMALRISSQNEQISSQNEQISAQADKIEEQYKEALVSNANAVGDNARTLLKQGDRVAAIEKALSVYPKDGEALPYLQKVEYVLSDALNLYESGTRLKADKLLYLDSVVSDIILSPKGKKLIALGSDKSMWICDTVSGKVLEEFTVEDADIRYNTIAFIDEDSFFYGLSNEIYIYNISSKQSEKFGELDNLSCEMLSYSEEKNRLLGVGFDGIYLFDTCRKKLITKIDLESVAPNEAGNYSFVGYSDISRFEDGSDNYFVCCFEDVQTEAKLMCVFDSEDGTFIGSEHIENSTVGDLKLYGNNLYIALGRYKDGTRNFESSNFESEIVAYDISRSGLSRKWSNIVDFSFISRIAVAQDGQGAYVACSNTDSVTVFGREDGGKVNVYQMSSYVVDLFGLDAADSFVCITKDGNWCSISPLYGDPMISNVFECNSVNVIIFRLRGCVVTVPMNSNIITVYRTAFAYEYEELAEVEERVISEVETDEEMLKALKELGVKETLINNVFKDDASRFLGVSYKNMSTEIFRLDANGMPVENCRKYSDMGAYMNSMYISDDGQYMILASDEIAYLFRTEGVDYSNDFPDDSMKIAYISGFRGVDYTQPCIFVQRGRGYLRIPLYSAEKVGDIGKEVLESISQ